MDTWEPDRVTELAALVNAAMPHEGLTADELLACCWDDPGIVLGAADGSGAAAGVVRCYGEHVVGHLKVLAVHPGGRRLGTGRRLLAAIEAWAWDQGASEVHLGASAPFYLWPGVDVRALAMLCLAESAGYEPIGAALDMSVPTTFRAPAPEGVEVRRALTDDEASAVAGLVDAVWPEWVAEMCRAVEQGSCLAAFDPSGTAVGFACHSVNRAAWFGPIGTDPGRRHAGVGLALLGEVCKDLMVAGHPDTEICWIGPVGFYARAGGHISRVYRSLRKARP